MKNESRTTKSLKNAGVNVCFLTIQTIVGFWSRKAFYDYLGSEVIGLDTTAMSLLTFLNIAESGVGVAVAYFLYTPFYHKDTISINEIVTLQGWIYRRIACFILCVAVVLMGFFPWIFEDIQIPLWYAYATFSAMLFGNMLGYFINYRQSVLAADQKQYKVVKVTNASNIIFKILLILYLPYASHPFICYIGTNLLGYVIGCLWLNHVLKRNYPWLKSSQKTAKELLTKYPGITKKIKQLFIHRIAGFVIHQCTPLIMFSYSTLTVIAYYGNYLTLTDKLKQILQQAFSSTGAAVGQLIASKDQERSLKVFWELIDSRLCFSTAFFIILALFTEPFISVWLSPDYLLSKQLLYLVLLNMWFVLNRTTIDSYREGFGLFQDVWAPFAESIINLSIALVCGNFFGIEGVLLGGIASNLVIVYGWKPYFLFTKGFHLNYFRFFLSPYSARIVVAFVLVFALLKIADYINIQMEDYLHIFSYMFAFSIIIISLLYTVFYLLFPGMKSFNKRMTGLIRNKLH